MRCVECKVEADDVAAGWRAYFEDAYPPVVLLYCPGCAERLFGPPKRRREQRRS